MAAFRHGVLFTEMVPGVSLTQLLCAEPQRVGELLGHVWAELRELHRPEMARRFARSVAIEERGIAGIFARKFTDIGANVYLDQLVAEWRDYPGGARRVVGGATKSRDPVALSQVRAVLAFLEKVSVELAAGTDPQSAWRLGLLDAVTHLRLAVTA